MTPARGSHEHPYAESVSLVPKLAALNRELMMKRVIDAGVAPQRERVGVVHTLKKIVCIEG